MPTPPAFLTIWRPRIVRFGSFDNRLLCFTPSHPQPSPNPLSSWSTRDASGRPCSPSPWRSCVFFPNLPVLFNLFAALPLLLRVTIDPAKRQTAKSGPAVPSTQGGKTLSKSSALHLSPHFSSFSPSSVFFYFFFCPPVTHLQYSVPLSFSLMCPCSKLASFYSGIPFFLSDSAAEDIESCRKMKI